MGSCPVSVELLVQCYLILEPSSLLGVTDRVAIPTGAAIPERYMDLVFDGNSYIKWQNKDTQESRRVFLVHLYFLYND